MLLINAMGPGPAGAALPAETALCVVMFFMLDKCFRYAMPDASPPSFCNPSRSASNCAEVIDGFVKYKIISARVLSINVPLWLSSRSCSTWVMDALVDCEANWSSTSKYLANSRVLIAFSKAVAMFVCLSKSRFFSVISGMALNALARPAVMLPMGSSLWPPAVMSARLFWYSSIASWTAAATFGKGSPACCIQKLSFSLTSKVWDLAGVADVSSVPSTCTVTLFNFMPSTS
mmetsp:Transcript_20674/g.58644  ORF Transcript_20674/g.58644 Transcript_20674/m.58644 type:complete len:232 (+) Transcript_20674:451-1146(+)